MLNFVSNFVSKESRFCSDSTETKWDNLSYGCQTKHIIWSRVLAYQEVSSLEDDVRYDADGSLVGCMAMQDWI